MVSKVLSCGLIGINGHVITVEVDASGGLPYYSTVGLADKAVTESQERVRSAMRNSKLPFHVGRIIVNLAPANMKKVGNVYDLPIAIGIMAAIGAISSEALEDCLFVGELALDGSIRRIDGAISMAIKAKETGLKRLFVPEENASEAAYVKEIEVVACKSLLHVVEMLREESPIEAVIAEHWISQADNGATDFSVIRGQYAAKRAAEVAAAGGHNLLMVGAPGGGKTMLAKALPSILPELTFDEALEITRIHSAAGRLLGNGVVSSRPFCAPHHTASNASIVGGGANSRPGEISIAHLGVMFLDEMPEFEREVLESLRQPMEDGIITIARVNATATYPARFMLVGAMNPCPCGNYGSKTRKCSCTASKVNGYKRRLSGPLLDRIDIFIQMEEITYYDLHSKKTNDSENSSKIRNRVNECRKIQQDRFKGMGIFCNAHMSQSEIEKFCILDKEAEFMYRYEFGARNFNGRANARALRLARTIADMEKSDKIGEDHISEALQYRSQDGIWG